MLNTNWVRNMSLYNANKLELVLKAYIKNNGNFYTECSGAEWQDRIAWLEKEIPLRKTLALLQGEPWVPENDW